MSRLQKVSNFFNKLHEGACVIEQVLGELRQDAVYATIKGERKLVALIIDDQVVPVDEDHLGFVETAVQKVHAVLG